MSLDTMLYGNVLSFLNLSGKKFSEIEIFLGTNFRDLAFDCENRENFPLYGIALITATSKRQFCGSTSNMRLVWKGEGSVKCSPFTHAKYPMPMPREMTILVLLRCIKAWLDNFARNGEIMVM